MSDVTVIIQDEVVNYTTGVMQGLTGAGLLWDNNPWEVGGTYVESSALMHYGSSYRAKQAHIATGDNEPGIGINWEDYWRLLSGLTPEIIAARDVALSASVAAIDNKEAAEIAANEAITITEDTRSALVIIATNLINVQRLFIEHHAFS
jgi:hypothetical protein